MFYFRMWRLDVVLSNMEVKSELYEQFLWMLQAKFNMFFSKVDYVTPRLSGVQKGAPSF